MSVKTQTAETELQEHQPPTMPGHQVMAEVISKINEEIAGFDAGTVRLSRNDIRAFVGVLQAQCMARTCEFIPEDQRHNLVFSAITVGMKLNPSTPKNVLLFADTQIGAKAVDEFLESVGLARVYCDTEKLCAHAIRAEEIEEYELAQAEHFEQLANPLVGLLQALERSGMGVEVIELSSPFGRVADD